MPVSANKLKWIMRFYPPLFFQRIWVVRFKPDFTGVEVKVKKSFWNRNYNNSIFGGTIFSAADPFYPVLFFQIFTLKGYSIRAWSKSSEIQYIKPGYFNLNFKINIDDDEIKEAEEILNTVGKYAKFQPVEIFDVNGVNVASVKIEVYMRNLDFIETDADANE
jgi:hypothetical protein